MKKVPSSGCVPVVGGTLRRGSLAIVRVWYLGTDVKNKYQMVLVQKEIKQVYVIPAKAGIQIFR